MDSPLDQAPDDGLAAAFRVPDYIRDDEELFELFNNLVAQLRQEALGIPMNTMQTILIARIAMKFVIIKYREENGWGAGLNAEKDTNQQWLEMVKEWNKLLAAGQAEMRANLMEQVESMALEGVQLIEDKANRQQVTQFFSTSFAKMGM